jgi:hypothetical protein
MILRVIFSLCLRVVFYFTVQEEKIRYEHLKLKNFSSLSQSKSIIWIKLVRGAYKANSKGGVCVPWCRRFGTLECGTDRSPETSIRNYRYTLRKIPKERRFHVLCFWQVRTANQLAITVVTLCQKRLYTPDLTHNFCAPYVIGSDFEPLKSEGRLNKVWKLSSYRTGNSTRLCYKDGRLMLCKDIMAGCYLKNTKHVNAVWAERSSAWYGWCYCDCQARIYVIVPRTYLCTKRRASGL